VKGQELYYYDPLGTITLVKDINESGSSSPSNLVSVQTNLVFVGDDGVHGRELWKYDGTTASMIKDINSGIGDAF